VMPDMSATAGVDGEEEESRDRLASMEEDALDVAEREEAAEVAALATKLALRSSAIQRGLPRPLVVNREAALDADPGDTASGLLAAEMLRMLEADASNDPPKGAPEGIKKRKALKPVKPAVLEQARDLLAQEMTALPSQPAPHEYAAAWTTIEKQIIYVPALQKYAAASSVSEAERLGACEQQMQLLKNAMTRDAKRAGKLEKKLEVLLGGYRKRAAAVERKCQEQQQAIQERQMELSCFKALQRDENQARPQRFAAMQMCLSVQVEREAQLQERYAVLARMHLTMKESSAQ